MTLARQALAPVVIVGLAFLAWWISDRLLYVGPLDRATFGWVVVVPLWAAAPTFAGFSWRGMPAAARTRLAAFAGMLIGGVAAVVIWQSVATPAFGCAPSHTAIELAPPALAIGAVIGGGLALACAMATGQIVAGRIGRGVIYGAVIQLLVVPAASMLFFVAFSGLCQRP